MKKVSDVHSTANIDPSAQLFFFSSGAQFISLLMQAP